MKLSRERLLSESEGTGFRPEVLEKVIQLLNLLQRFQEHPYLGNRIVLKGGTALNLFFFDVPRLSVDIDLNYIGGVDPDTMLSERPAVQEAVKAVCKREDFSVGDAPSEHAGGKWRLRYESALGHMGNLELDLNFMLRLPLWPVGLRDSHQVGSFSASQIQLLDIHELAAGKLAALLARREARDLFDAHLLLTQGELDRERLRIGFVVYGAMSRRDWREVRTDDVSFEAVQLRNHLLPTLRNDFASRLDDPLGWADRLVAECRDALAAILPLSDSEREFLDRLLDEGEIDPTPLTSDQELAQRIARHPMLHWKAQNVREWRRR